MELVHAIDELGIKVASPNARSIRVLFAPDRHAVDELTFSVVVIDPDNGTDNHVHDRPELIFIVAGRAEATVDGVLSMAEADTALYIRTGEWHQIRNASPEPLKMVTVFVPGIRADVNYRRCLESIPSLAPAGVE